jgi:hypothetical protein
MASTGITVAFTPNTNRSITFTLSTSIAIDSSNTNGIIGLTPGTNIASPYIQHQYNIAIASTQH